MRKSRWLAPWKDDPQKPVIYHVVSRVVDRRFVLGDEEREHFNMIEGQTFYYMGSPS